MDFGYRPQQWRTAICPPDDTYKTLVTEKGALVYHLGRVDGDFATSVRVVVDDGEKITSQKMVSPRLPIVQTRLEAGSLSILEEAFAAEKQTPNSPPFKIVGHSRRHALGTDGLRAGDWAKPRPASRSDLRRSPAGRPQPIHYQIKMPPGGIGGRGRRAVRRMARSGPDQRVLDIKVEGAHHSDRRYRRRSGKERRRLFWFDAKDANGDGLIDLTVTAAKNAKDKNAILNGFWVFDPSVKRDAAAVLSGSLDSQALSVNYAGQPDFESRKDFILVRVTNNGDSARTIEPKVIVESALRLDTVDDGQIQVDSHEKGRSAPRRSRR